LPINKPKNILIAPLDWGAGHTTRCIPIIRYLLERGHNPILAGNAAQRKLIIETFYNTIGTTPLEGYNITYSAWNRVAQAGLLLQMPKIMRAIKQEYQWLQKAVNDLQIDGIISDNRYGLHHPSIPSVIMTHQLRVMSGMGGVADNMVQQAHYDYLNRFNTTWVLDTENEPSLARNLSHSNVMPAQYSYIGLLSRFADISITRKPDNGHLLFLLSGPEPQRSNLSRILWRQVLDYKGKVIFAEGSDNATPPVNIPGHITYHKRLAGADLVDAIQGASMVICRSGYSTIMDLVATGKKAILIPTPGQTEQEYLGKYLQKQGMFYSRAQNGFDLNSAIGTAESFPYKRFLAEGEFDVYKGVVDNWLAEL
jgi:UDP:flavonoid glycosyltransferase YjiC (YdhE family)